MNKNHVTKMKYLLTINISQNIILEIVIHNTTCEVANAKDQKTHDLGAV